MVYAALGFVKFHGVVWGEILSRKLEAETCGARLAVERVVSFRATASALGCATGNAASVSQAIL